MANDLNAFLTKMEEDTAFAEDVKAKCKDIAESEEVADEKELLVKVGMELGYDFTLGNLERYVAGLQELDDDELSRVAGGFIIKNNTRTWCWFEAWGCFIDLMTG